MVDYCIYDILDHILPNADRSNHDTLRLEYLSACKVMENEIINILPQIPATLFEPLLQSMIYNCYSKFVNSFDSYRNLNGINIPFTVSLGILILSWPYEELILRNQIPPLHPSVDIFVSRQNQLASTAVSEVEDMLNVFNIFCNRLIKFIMQSIFNCTLTNAQGIACKLRIIDVTGLKMFNSDILAGINNSEVDKFGYRINIYSDAGTVIITPTTGGFELTGTINEQRLKLDLGNALSFKTITVSKYIKSFWSQMPLPNEVYNVLDLNKCEYIYLRGFNIDQKSAEKLGAHYPGLLGITLASLIGFKSLEFLCSFQYLEHLSLTYCKNTSLIVAICNMNKGLKYLNLTKCSLSGHALDCLANSIHVNTLKELHITYNYVDNDSEAVGLITLCQNLINVKVFIFDYCSLNKLSSQSISNLVNAIKDCITLEFLSMKDNSFSLYIINMIIDGLAQNKSLRYLGLHLPEMHNPYAYNEDYEMHRNVRLNNDDDDYEICIININGENWNIDEYNEAMEFQQNLCKRLHEKINIIRHFPIYISWC